MVRRTIALEMMITALFYTCHLKMFSVGYTTNFNFMGSTKDKNFNYPGCIPKESIKMIS